MFCIKFFERSKGHGLSLAPISVNNKTKFVICSGAIGFVVFGTWIGGVMALHECIKDCKNINTENIIFTASLAALMGGLIGTASALAYTEKQSVPLSSADASASLVAFGNN